MTIAHFQGCATLTARLAAEQAVGSRETKLDRFLAASEEQAHKADELLQLARGDHGLLQRLADAEIEKAQRTIVASCVADLAAACGMEVQDGHLVCKACELCNGSRYARCCVPRDAVAEAAAHHLLGC